MCVCVCSFLEIYVQWFCGAVLENESVCVSACMHVFEHVCACVCVCDAFCFKMF